MPMIGLRGLGIVGQEIERGRTFGRVQDYLVLALQLDVELFFCHCHDIGTEYVRLTARG